MVAQSPGAHMSVCSLAGLGPVCRPLQCSSHTPVITRHCRVSDNTCNLYTSQVSIDPRRVYVTEPKDTPHTVLKASKPGPNGEQWCWWQCTVKGGREGRDIDAVQLAKAVEAMGAGEILLNCIDNDGAGQVRWLLAAATRGQMACAVHVRHCQVHVRLVSSVLAPCMALPLDSYSR